jgi:hypothetical protein
MSEIRFKCEHCNMELGAPPDTGERLPIARNAGKRFVFQMNQLQGLMKVPQQIWSAC